MYAQHAENRQLYQHRRSIDHMEQQAGRVYCYDPSTGLAAWSYLLEGCWYASIGRERIEAQDAERARWMADAWTRLGYPYPRQVRH